MEQKSSEKKHSRIPEQSKSKTNNPALKKKILFYTILVLIPVFILAILEFILRLFSFGDNLGLFIPASDPKYLVCNHSVGKRYFSKFENTIPISDYFLKEKPSNGYRIFVLGESTVQGFPYEPNIAFPRILQRRLQDIFPERTIEIVNLGLTAICSYTLLDFADEILNQNPDIVLIYTGHNEYYGALAVGSMENGSIPVWLKNIHLKLVHFKVYQLLQKGISSIYKLFYPMTLTETKMTLMQHMVGKNVIPYGSELYNEGLNQFKYNMSKLLTKFKDAGIPVIISDLVSNIKDLPPFQSVDYKNYSVADSLFEEAGQFEISSHFEKAREKYLQAKDLDVIRFRASEDFNRMISNLADSFNIYRISIKSLFEKNSPNGLVGNNLMTEHLHPNADGYFLMADCFFNSLKENGLIESNWDTTKIRSWKYYRNNWGFTELDSSIAALRIKHLKAGWPFKSINTVNNFKFNYIPKGIIDSLAFLTLKYNDVSIEKVHKDLAAYYRTAGDLKRASREYLSLAYTYPFNASYFYNAAEFADKAKDYDNAIRILWEAPFPKKSIYTQYSLASVYFEKQNYDEALNCIDNLYRINPDKKNKLQADKLKYKILKAAGRNDEAEQTLLSIKENEPGYNPEKENNKPMILIPEKIKPYIEKAGRLRKEGKMSEAIMVLTEANKVYETSYANLMIGMMLISQKNLSAQEYLEKAYKEIKDDPMLVYNLGLIYLIKKDLPNAKIKINEFVKMVGKDHPRALQLIEFYKKVAAKK